MNKPLQNKTILVTRDEKSAAGFIKKIEALGGRAVPFPTIKIQSPGSWRACDEALRNITSYDWIVFTSANAVEYFFHRADELSVRKLPVKIAVVGRKTEDALKQHGKHADLIPMEYSAAGLLDAFETTNVLDNRVLFPASNIARDDVVTGLQNRGAVVDTVVVYETVPNRAPDAAAVRRQLTDGCIDCLTFFSPSAFESFVELMGTEVFDDIKKRPIAVAAIGPTTADAVRKSGLDVDVRPRRSLEDDLLAALSAYYVPPE